MGLSPLICNFLNGCFFELTGEPLLESAHFVAHIRTNGKLVLESSKSLFCRFVLLFRQLELFQLFHLLLRQLGRNEARRLLIGSAAVLRSSGLRSPV